MSTTTNAAETLTFEQFRMRMLPLVKDEVEMMQHMGDWHGEEWYTAAKWDNLWYEERVLVETIREMKAREDYINRHEDDWRDRRDGLEEF